MNEHVPGDAPVPKTNPFLKYTLRGQSAKLDELAIAQKPLFGGICLTGQVTVFCAPPNAGKTLIVLSLVVDAVATKVILGEDVHYIDADDTTQGVADKVRLLDEYGVNVIAQGYNGFKAPMLTSMLEQMIEEETARGKAVIIDTLKKFTQPMSKADTSAFLDVMRRFVLAGGTFVCLAHTNKNPGPDGKNVFAGVMDILDDVDCVYTIDVKVDAEAGRRVAVFTNQKRRGSSPDTAVYSYAAAPDMAYFDRLISVREDADEYAEYGEPTNSDADTENIIDHLRLFIRHNPSAGKMEIVRFVAEHCGVSRRQVSKLLDAHTGDDPSQHKWRYVLKARGRHAFDLLHPDGS